MMDRNTRSLVRLALVALATVACSDSVKPITAPASASMDRARADALSSADAERAALARIGKVVAMSLGEKSARQQLKNRMRASPFKEHKLELGAYVRSEEGRQSLSRVAGGRASDDLLTLLEQVRPLEFYMPVRTHRETWVGDEEVLVAVQLEEEDPVVAFNARGEEIRLDPNIPPGQATLSIVPSETRFDRPMPASSRNVGDLNGNAVGTPTSFNPRMSSLIAAEPGDGGGGGGGSSAVPPGLYLEFSRILDMHEPWTRGDPEIEVHIQGPTDAANPRLGVDLSCSGEHAYDYRKVFNQDGGFWDGRVMLFSAEEISRYNSQFPDGFHVFFWEDDDSPCVLKLDNNTLIELIKSTAAAVGAVSVKASPSDWRVAAGLFLAALFSNPGEWLKTNDDFVGAAVYTSITPYLYLSTNHVILKGTTLNGRANLYIR
jgi:hypothetical protein